MKKMMAIILSAAMAFGFTAAAMAEDKAPYFEESQTRTISHTISEKYNWEMPSELTLIKQEDGKVSAASTLAVSGAVLRAGNVVKLTIATTNFSNGEHHLKNGDNEVAYDISINSKSMAGKTEGLVRTVDGDASFNFGIVTTTAPDPHLAGTWSDTITFTTQVVEDDGTVEYCN